MKAILNQLYFGDNTKKHTLKTKPYFITSLLVLIFKASLYLLYMIILYKSQICSKRMFFDPKR